RASRGGRGWQEPPADCHGGCTYGRDHPAAWTRSGRGQERLGPAAVRDAANEIHPPGAGKLRDPRRPLHPAPAHSPGSKVRLAAATTTAIATPGAKASRGWSKMNMRYSNSMPPQSGAVGSAPSPMNDSAAKATTAAPAWALTWANS